MLLNLLYSTREFRSLTYRDMPFVMMSGTWKTVSGSHRLQSTTKERAHGDRILVDYDSAEAFEEVFWKTFCGERFVFDQHLQPHKVNRKTQKQFCDFIRSVLASDDQLPGRRYLSKNNNNILRLKALRSALPGATILIPFREPLEHARSLLKQHQRFCDIHREDSFALNYMNWLGHFEFGMGHRPFRFNEQKNPYSPYEINYWLQIWCNTYSWLLAEKADQMHFIGYERACEAPAELFEALAPLVGVTANRLLANSKYAAVNRSDNTPAIADSNLAVKSQEIYRNLCQQALNQAPET